MYCGCLVIYSTHCTQVQYEYTFPMRIIKRTRKHKLLESWVGLHK